MVSPSNSHGGERSWCRMSILLGIFHHSSPFFHRVGVKEVWSCKYRKIRDIYLLSLLLSLFHPYPPARRPYARIREGGVKEERSSRNEIAATLVRTWKIKFSSTVSSFFLKGKLCHCLPVSIVASSTRLVTNALPTCRPQLWRSIRRGTAGEIRLVSAAFAARTKPPNTAMVNGHWCYPTTGAASSNRTRGSLSRMPLKRVRFAQVAISSLGPAKGWLCTQNAPQTSKWAKLEYGYGHWCRW